MPQFKEIILRARQNLPLEKQSKPWSFINHGIDLLKDEDELNCYLAAYGKMHEEKIITALHTIENIDKLINSSYEIIDWGCGQGLATLCFLDFIKERQNNKLPEKVTLIEPSLPALSRAETFVKHNTKNNVNVKLVNQKLDNVKKDDVASKQAITINFFSNILDIESIDLKRLANLVKNNLLGEQYFICTGPLNAKSTRIDEFATLLNDSVNELIKEEKGKLKNTRGTIKLLVFKIKGQEVKIIKSIYYPPMPKNNNIMHILQKKLNAIDPNKLDKISRIMEYYKLVVELEQLKEPQIDKNDYVYYKYHISNENELIIDLETNSRFLNIFNNNRNPAITPNYKAKDLNISLEIKLENKTYPILTYTFLFEDIKDIDTTTEKIQIKISGFELNYSTLSNLQKSESEIDEIEGLLKDTHSIEDAIKLFEDKLENKILFDNKVLVALSSKNPSLSRIYSELRRINKSNVNEKSLIYDFLFNNSIDNKIAELKEKDLIQITKLDSTQEKAVLSAFNNKVSVITGPPGSGKTQVITNVIANAIVRHKKILVSSKNNKAVDNVKAKFDEISQKGYFLRFGKTSILEETTIPGIDKISAMIPKLEDKTLEIESIKEKLDEFRELRFENRKKIKNRDLLLKRLPKIKLEIERLESHQKKLKDENLSFEQIREVTSLEKIEDQLSNAKKNRNNFELKYSGLNKIWIDWFTKKKHAFNLINLVDTYQKEIKLQLKTIPDQISKFKNGIEILESYNYVIKFHENIVEYTKKFLNLETDLKNKEEYYTKAEKYIASVNSQEKEINNKIANFDKHIIDLSRNLLNEEIENKLYNSVASNISNYKDYLPNHIPTWPPESIPPFIDATNNFLDIINSICVTSLSAKASLPLTNDLFDLVVIDEASQCDIASAIPLILRAKQIVVVGDPLQLKHISSVNNFEEEKIKEHFQLTNSVYLKYKDKSLYDYSKDFLIKAKNNNEVVNIDNHYRCHPDIIEYSNQVYYKPKLNLDLKIHTKVEQFDINPKGMFWEDVVGKLKSKTTNVNNAELKKSIEIAEGISNEYPKKSIGIVTPFRHQANTIYQALPENLKSKILVATVHKFQGDEKDVMIYSLVVTDKTEADEDVPDSKIYWINKMVPESINVAITRARNTIYIIGNKEYIRSNSIGLPLGKLVNYEENLNR